MRKGRVSRVYRLPRVVGGGRARRDAPLQGRRDRRGRASTRGAPTGGAAALCRRWSALRLRGVEGVGEDGVVVVVVAGAVGGFGDAWEDGVDLALVEGGGDVRGAGVLEHLG